MKVAITATLIIVSLALNLVAQEKKADPPKIKDDVKLSLVQTQNELYKLALQMKNLEAQYNAAQAQFTKLQGKLQADTQGALDKSGIDAEKYEINAETFDVTEKPKAK